MKHMLRIWLFAAALSLAGAELAAAAATPAAQAGSPNEMPPEFSALRAQGIELHYEALEGDDDAAGEAVERLERYLERFPGDAEARAYLGSAYALMGRDASSVINRTRYANRGLRHLDRALDEAPRAFVVRLIRANVNTELPKMFKRGGAALQDMLALDEIYRVKPSPRLAREMIAIYEALQRRAPDAGPWAERLDRARALSREQPGR